MARAFVLVENGKFDVKPAEIFGKITYLLNGRNVRSAFATQQLCNVIAENLDASQFNPDSDYVVLVGSQIMVAMFVATIAVKYGKATLLVFDATESNYVVRKVSWKTD